MCNYTLQWEWLFIRCLQMQSELRQPITLKRCHWWQIAFQSPLCVFFGTLSIQVRFYPGNRTYSLSCVFFTTVSRCFSVGSYRVAQESTGVRVPPRESCCFLKTLILPWIETCGEELFKISRPNLGQCQTVVKAVNTDFINKGDYTYVHLNVLNTHSAATI